MRHDAVCGRTGFECYQLHAAGTIAMASSTDSGGCLDTLCAAPVLSTAVLSFVRSPRCSGTSKVVQFQARPRRNGRKAQAAVQPANPLIATFTGLSTPDSVCTASGERESSTSWNQNRIQESLRSSSSAYPVVGCSAIVSHDERSWSGGSAIGVSIVLPVCLRSATLRMLECPDVDGDVPSRNLRMTSITRHANCRSITWRLSGVGQPHR